MDEYWFLMQPQSPVVAPGLARRLSWRVLDERGIAVAAGCREYRSYSAAIDDARTALRRIGASAESWQV